MTGPFAYVTLLCRSSRARHHVYALTSAFAFFSLPALAQSDTRCLNADDVSRLSKLNAETVRIFRVEDISAEANELRELGRSLSERGKAVTDCQRENSGVFDSLLDNCQSEIQSYNAIVQRFDALSASLESRQSLALRQLRLNRSMFAKCE